MFRIGAGVVAWTGKTWVGTSVGTWTGNCVGTGTGGQGLVLGIQHQSTNLRKSIQMLFKTNNRNWELGLAAGAKLGYESVEGRKDNLRSKQTYKGVLDPEVNCGTSL